MTEEGWRLEFESGRVGFLLDAAHRRRKDRRFVSVAEATCGVLALATAAVVVCALVMP